MELLASRSCGERLPQAAFGRNQWDRARAAKGGDCKRCQGRGEENAGQEQARRV